MASNNMPYRIVKAKTPGTTVCFNTEDPEAFDALRVPHRNRDWAVSMAYYEDSDPSSPHTYGLVFCFTSDGFEQVHRSALGAVPYVRECLTVVDILCMVADIRPEENNQPSYSGRHSSRAAATPPEIIVSVAPSVFDARPTPLALPLNRELARQMREDGIEADVDCYSQAQQSVPLPKATSALEVCRIIAGFYPFIGAGEDEVWHHVHRIGRRHGLQQGARLRAIVTFGSENPVFVGCKHPLLGQFCPAAGCFTKDLADEITNPRLFT